MNVDTSIPSRAPAKMTILAKRRDSEALEPNLTNTLSLRHNRNQTGTFSTYGKYRSNMPRHSVRVECYAGTRADVSPRRIKFYGRKYVVASVLAETVEEQISSRQQLRRYKILTGEGLVLEVVRADDGSWYLES